jgi:hypothetical protein
VENILENILNIKISFIFIKASNYGLNIYPIYFNLRLFLKFDIIWIFVHFGLVDVFSKSLEVKESQNCL